MHDCVFFALNPSPQNGRNIFGGWLRRVSSSTKKWSYFGSVHHVSKFSVAKMIKYLITKKNYKKISKNINPHVGCLHVLKLDPLLIYDAIT